MGINVDNMRELPSSSSVVRAVKVKVKVKAQGE